MRGPRRLLLTGLLVILAVVMVDALVGILVLPRLAVDIEIPLRAGERWLGGLPVYLPDAFDEPPGRSLPFLYPPYTLPFLAVLSQLPREPVDLLGVLGLGTCAIVACRRLAVPWPWVLPVLAWPPFSEGIVSGNIQIALFAAFAYLFFVPGGTRWRPLPRDLSSRDVGATRIGFLATIIGAIKVSQPHPWVGVLRYRPMAAVSGLIAAAVVVAVTVPLTGIDQWRDWFAQLRLASDPAWDEGGVALTRYLPGEIGLLLAAGCLTAVWFVPRRAAGAWIGILSVVGSLSLHTFGLLFLLPAMLMIRRELAIVAATLIATYTLQGTWAGILLVAVAFAVSQRRPNLLEDAPMLG